MITPKFGKGLEKVTQTNIYSTGQQPTADGYSQQERRREKKKYEQKIWIMEGNVKCLGITLTLLHSQEPV